MSYDNMLNTEACMIVTLVARFYDVAIIKRYIKHLAPRSRMMNLLCQPRDVMRVFLSGVHVASDNVDYFSFPPRHNKRLRQSSAVIRIIVQEDRVSKGRNYASGSVREEGFLSHDDARARSLILYGIKRTV